MNSKNWIKKIRQPNTMGFRYQTEECAVTIEAPWPSVLYNFNAGLIMAVEQFIGNLSISCFVSEFESL